MYLIDIINFVFSYLRVLEKSHNDRLKTSELFAKLVKQGQINLADYCTGLADILEQADDLKIDIPKFWDYLAEILGKSFYLYVIR